jgi:YidC/Oxa1 family membrane protein insertase
MDQRDPQLSRTPYSADQQKRLFLTIALSMAVLLSWQFFFGPKPPQRREQVTDGGQVMVADGGTLAVLPTPSEAPVKREPDAIAEPPPAQETHESFTTPAQELVFSSRGGGLSRAVIRSGGVAPDYKFERRTGKEVLVDMVRVRPGQPLPFSSALKGDVSLAYDAPFAAERKPDGMVFRASAGEVSLEKQYTVNPNGYELRAAFKLTNHGAATRNVVLSLVYPAFVDPRSEKEGGFFSPPPEISQVLCRYGSSTEPLVLKKEKESASYPGPVRFVGFDERYFLGALFPRFAGETACTLAVDPSGERLATLEIQLPRIGPDASITREVGLYLGPKDFSELRRVSVENRIGSPMITLKDGEPKPGASPGFDPELTEAIDFGWWAVICTVLLQIMKFFQRAFVNWGIAIILLTVVVKGMLYPLTKKSMQSMEAMKKLQPKIDELRKKYAADKEKLNLETMRMYQENKVNPFGGCLPMFVQMPVWIALYRTLLTSFELYREPLLPVWISDLTAADPYYILPLAMGVTMFITQKMQPQMGDPTQAKVMLYFMPIFFTAIMLNLPAGLTLYIFTNNLLSIAQQKYLQRSMSKSSQAASA